MKAIEKDGFRQNDAEVLVVKSVVPVEEIDVEGVVRLGKLGYTLLFENEGGAGSVVICQPFDSGRNLFLRPLVDTGKFFSF